MEPVRRSHIYGLVSEAGMDGGYEGISYPDAPVQTPRDQMHIIKLETRYRSSVANETAMHLPAPQIPQTHHAIGRPTRQGGVEDL